MTGIYHIEATTYGVCTNQFGYYTSREQAEVALQAWKEDSDSWYTFLCAQLDRDHEERLLAMIDDGEDGSDQVEPVVMNYPTRSTYRVVECHEGRNNHGDALCITCFEEEMGVAS